MSPEKTGTAGTGRVPALMVGGTIVAAESFAFGVLAVLEIWSFSPDRPEVAIGSTIIFALVALGLAVAAWGLVNAHPRSRAPVIVTQIFMILVANSLQRELVDESVARWAPVLIIAGGLVIVLIFLPRSRRAFTQAAHDGVRD